MDTTQSQPDSKPRIQDDRPARRRRRWPWVILVVIAALVAIGGIVVIWNPFETTVLFVMVLGVLLVVTGASNLVIELAIRKNLAEA